MPQDSPAPVTQIFARSIIGTSVQINDLGGFNIDTTGVDLLQYFNVFEVVLSTDLKNKLQDIKIEISDGERILSYSEALKFLRIETDWEDDKYIDQAYEESTEPPDSTNVIWLNPEENMVYYYDSSRNEWITADSKLSLAYTRNSPFVYNMFLREGEVSHIHSGYLIPRPAMIVGIYGRNTFYKPGRKIYLYDYDTMIYEINWPNKNLSNLDISYNLDPGVILKVKSDDRVQYPLSRPVVVIEIVWRYNPNWDGTVPSGNDR